MTPADLAAWLITLPALLDGAGHKIPRDNAHVVAITIASADVGTLDSTSQFFAGTLDMLAAFESGYRAQVAGDCPGLPAGDAKCTRDLGARSCGAFQLSCKRVTPTTTLLEQARMAVATLKRAIDVCPEHPLWVYATGRCVVTATAQRYEETLRKQLKAGGL